MNLPQKQKTASIKIPIGLAIRIRILVKLATSKKWVTRWAGIAMDFYPLRDQLMVEVESDLQQKNPETLAEASDEPII